MKNIDSKITKLYLESVYNRYLLREEDKKEPQSEAGEADKVPETPKQDDDVKGGKTLKPWSVEVSDKATEPLKVNNEQPITIDTNSKDLPDVRVQKPEKHEPKVEEPTKTDAPEMPQTAPQTAPQSNGDDDKYRSPAVNWNRPIRQDAGTLDSLRGSSEVNSGYEQMDGYTQSDRHPVYVNPEDAGYAQRDNRDRARAANEYWRRLRNSRSR